MPVLTRELLDEILPIVLKDPAARNDFRLYRQGRGTFQSAKNRIRYHAHRVLNNREIQMTRDQRIRLLEFCAAFPPGPNAGKTEDPVDQFLSFRCTQDEKEEIERTAARSKRENGESRSDWLRRAAMLLVRIETGEIGISTPEDPAVGH